MYKQSKNLIFDHCSRMKAALQVVSGAYCYGCVPHCFRWTHRFGLFSFLIVLSMALSSKLFIRHEAHKKDLIAGCHWLDAFQCMGIIAVAGTIRDRDCESAAGHPGVSKHCKFAQKWLSMPLCGITLQACCHGKFSCRTHPGRKTASAKPCPVLFLTFAAHWQVIRREPGASAVCCMRNTWRGVC